MQEVVLSDQQQDKDYRNKFYIKKYQKSQMVQEKGTLRGKRNIICELYGYIYKGSLYI